MFKNNRTFFLLFIVFLIIGGILLANIEQGDAIRYFSDRRGPFGALFFTYFTKVGEEFSYLALFVIFLFIQYRYSLLVVLAGVLATGVSYLLKMAFKHPRPSVYFKDLDFLDQINFIEGVHLLTGSLSFPSGHTTSAFLLFGLMALLYARKWYWNAGLFLVALLVGISRIYLVQHFLKDVYTGAITGVLLAMLVYWINEKIPYKESRWLDQSLLSSRKIKNRV